MPKRNSDLRSTFFTCAWFFSLSLIFNDISDNEKIKSLCILSLCANKVQKKGVSALKRGGLEPPYKLCLDVWEGSEYASVICYSLFGKIEDANKLDSVAV